MDRLTTSPNPNSHTLATIELPTAHPLSELSKPPILDQKKKIWRNSNRRMVTDAGGIKIPDVWPDVQTVITTRFPKTHMLRENSAGHDVQQIT